MVKREASHRNVPIPPAIYRELMEWRKVQRESRIKKPATPDALVFASERTDRVMWPGTWLQKRIKPLAATAGIKNVN